MTMKVYEMNEYDLVAANSAEEAVTWYQRRSGEPLQDILDENCPREVSEEEMSIREVTDELGPTVTFAEHLERATARNNPPATEPFLFASTEY